MHNKGARQDLEITRIAERQHGVVTAAQLREVGLGRGMVSRRAQRGRLRRIHQGVYAVGHRALTQHGWYMAAVLALGADAVLSHRSAAVLWGLLEPRGGQAHVSVPSASGRKRRRRIHVHRRAALGAGDVTRRHRVPVTTPARTIADLRGAVAEAERRRAIRQAEVLGLRADIEPADPTRSELEDRFLRLCEEHGLPRPEVNVRVGRWEVDFLWRDRRLAVETDGYRYHRGRTAFEDDHARDLDLRAAGYTVLRLTYGQVTTGPDRVADLIRRELNPTTTPRP